MPKGLNHSANIAKNLLEQLDNGNLTYIRDTLRSLPVAYAVAATAYLVDMIHRKVDDRYQVGRLTRILSDDL